MKPVNNLIFKTFAKKFNEKYSSDLLEEQKSLLQKYLHSFADNGVELKIFLNEEIGRLKEQCETLSEGKWSDKISLVKEKLEDFKKKPLTEEVVRDVFHIQQLLTEIKPISIWSQT